MYLAMVLSTISIQHAIYFIKKYEAENEAVETNLLLDV
jgi:hypothetical protein